MVGEVGGRSKRDRGERLEILTLSIGVGVLFGFFLWEKTGLQPGGWVVPGYIAFFFIGSLVTCGFSFEFCSYTLYL